MKRMYLFFTRRTGDGPLKHISKQNIPKKNTLFKNTFFNDTLFKNTFFSNLHDEKFNTGKKAIVGIGVLIIFIAAILVASVGAGVLLRTQTVLQSQALKTGAEAREAVSTNLALQSMTGTNGLDGTVEVLQSMLKLGASSRPVDFEKTIIVIGTSNASIALKYGGIGEDIHFTNMISRRVTEDIGSSPVRLRTDLDIDYIEDYAFLCDVDKLCFNLSSDEDFNITIRDLTFAGAVFSDTYVLASSDGKVVYGSITLAGTTQNARMIDSAVVVFINLVPEKVGYGVYGVNYLTRGKQHHDGAFVYGDIVRIYTDLSHPVLEGSEITIAYNTQDGVALTRSIVTPNSMTTEKVRLFP